MSSAKWLATIVLICLVVFVLMGLMVFFYDPYCYYRMPQDRFIVNNYRFLNAGIIKNADYDTAIIGSSMAQNFNMDMFREHMNMNPVKLTLGALSVEGFDLLYSTVRRIGKAQNIIFCIDLPSLNKKHDDMKVYPVYLYDDKSFNNFKYLWGYETWMRLLPLSIVFDVMNKSGFKLRRFYGTKNIDEIGAWDGDFPYGADIVLNAYLSGENQPSEQDLTGMRERMILNAEKLFSTLNCKPTDGKKYILFFPPYSMLYWHDVQQRGYFEIFQDIKRYIVDKFQGDENVAIFDFQTMPETMDLNNYRDITHYSGRINDLMVMYMAEDKMQIDSFSVEKYIDNLRNMIESFDESPCVTMIRDVGTSNDN